jgi:hypothetical protein
MKFIIGIVFGSVLGYVAMNYAAKEQASKREPAPPTGA